MHRLELENLKVGDLVQAGDYCVDSGRKYIVYDIYKVRVYVRTADGLPVVIPKSPSSKSAIIDTDKRMFRYHALKVLKKEDEES